MPPNPTKTPPAWIDVGRGEDDSESKGIRAWDRGYVGRGKDGGEKKGSSMEKIGNACERKYAEFESYDGMPKKGTPQHTWQKTQLGNAHASLNAKIQKELAENKGSTVWSERRVKL